MIPLPLFEYLETLTSIVDAVKNQSMLEWRALVPHEDSVSADLTTSSEEPERANHPVHHAFAFNNEFFASGQVDVAPKQSTAQQNSRGSHEFFYVVAGTAEVQIHRETFLLKRGCHFYVPPMNNYVINNPHGSTHLSVVFFRATQFDEDEE